MIRQPSLPAAVNRWHLGRKSVHPRLIQEALRHADISTTTSICAELGEGDLFRELPGKFPVPRMFAQQDEGGQQPKMRAVP